jgi:hypothetical protein
MEYDSLYNGGVEPGAPRLGKKASAMKIVVVIMLQGGYVLAK